LTNREKNEETGRQKTEVEAGGELPHYTTTNTLKKEKKKKLLTRLELAAFRLDLCLKV